MSELYNSDDKSKPQFRIATGLHESDPYWDSLDGIWRRKDDNSYDDEANDDRPDNEKYKNYPLIIILMLLVLLGLGYLVMWILDGLV